ncbi:probable galacturonosyltransferase 9 [Tanacetum coccineum]
MLNHLRFYLPEMYPKLHRILFSDDDVLVQKDLTAPWKVDMDGKVIGAVETCFGLFNRVKQIFNDYDHLIRDRFNPKACAWAFGMNMFDLECERLTDEYLYWHDLDEDGIDVDVHVYRSMIGSLMYLTASRPDIMFVVCACARHQVNPKASHLNAVKRIFRYLKHQPKLGLWYPRDSPFELEVSQQWTIAGAALTGITRWFSHFLVRKIEYLGHARTGLLWQVLWIQNYNDGLWL